MVLNIEAILYYVILIDSIGANVMTWCCSKWYKKNMNKTILKHFPASKGWTLWYLVLVLWIGFGLYRLGVLVY